VKRLVLAPTWLGDCVMALPTLRALRGSDPKGFLAVAAGRSGAPVFRLEGSASTVWESRGKSPAGLFADAARARPERFDEVWVLPNSFRSALLAFLCGSPRRLGYATDFRRSLLTLSPEAPLPMSHQLRYYDSLLEAGGVVPDVGPPRIAVPVGEAERARELLVGDRRFVFLAPGAAFGPTKLWPADRYALLGDALMDEGHGAAIIVGPDELELGRLVARRARHRIPVLGPELDTGRLAALLSLGSLLAGSDSGTAHLAAAVGTPVVAFFGPTDPERTRPAGARVEVLDRYVFCSPCYRRVCPYQHECMEEITVEMALGAARKLLREKEKGPEKSGP
jgi:heptosyltransferase-2